MDMDTEQPEPEPEHGLVDDTDTPGTAGLDDYTHVPSLDGALETDQLQVRLRARSPHPYHLTDLDYDTLKPMQVPPKTTQTKGNLPAPASDSGTEADDEHFLRGLPAPRTAPRKGVVKPDTSASTASADRTRTARTAKTPEVVRRAAELLLLVVLGAVVGVNPHARPVLRRYGGALQAAGGVVGVLLALYPVRVYCKTGRPPAVPAVFDPAPLLYPLAVPVLVALLLAAPTLPDAPLVHAVLALASLPRPLVPLAVDAAVYDALHWSLTLVPVSTSTLQTTQVPAETFSLLYPLHQTLCWLLDGLVATSLLPAERQLLSAALVGLLVLARSPQAVVLQALLWGGGVALLATCTPFVRWGVLLARLPRWRFRRPADETCSARRGSESSADELDVDFAPAGAVTPPRRRRKGMPMAPEARAFAALTHAQAVRRTWLYAAAVYACMGVTIAGGLRWYIGRFALAGHEPFGWAVGYLFGGLDTVRLEVVKANLDAWVCLPARVDDFRLDSCGTGWAEHVRQAWTGPASMRLLLFAYWSAVIALGLAVVVSLQRVAVDTRRKVFHFMMVGILLPATYVDPAFAALGLALVLAVFLLLEVLRASQLPPLSRPLARFLAPYTDGRDLRGPVIISHIFLLIGCAIPLWLSLAAVPRTPTADPCTRGWDVPTRDASMVAGVVCVGLGDAAASLTGRRWGRRKWIWGGGKSLEGSAAFAAAVWAGLLAASLWLRVGGWRHSAGSAPITTDALTHARTWLADAPAIAPRAGACAAMASLTEAVLTGGNDNVIVPVVLWTCVKGLAL